MGTGASKNSSTASWIL